MFKWFWKLAIRISAHLRGRVMTRPALKVSKPRRMPTTRRAVPDTRLAEIDEAAARTSEDPDLHSLLLRLHTETACRRGGALALRPMDLDPTQCLIRLQEKGDTVRWQPVSPTLMRHLLLHGEQRQAPPDGQLLRYRTGRPITRRRYDTLWGRIGEALPWAATQQISTHWLRHTTLTWVERNFGYAIARLRQPHRSRQRRRQHRHLRAGPAPVGSGAVNARWAGRRSSAGCDCRDRSGGDVHRPCADAGPRSSHCGPDSPVSGPSSAGT
ncbi:site-specific integrase [Dactylosporangium sp. NPDC000244]|uniref:tyrosine-type recombinase/integrase n=1 Tax=Dactylosporangium sp. NPDC000244 TaxID=3154365 RepID=UPI00331A8554